MLMKNRVEIFIYKSLFFHLNQLIRCWKIAAVAQEKVKMKAAKFDGKIFGCFNFQLRVKTRKKGEGMKIIKKVRWGEIKTNPPTSIFFGSFWRIF